MDENESYFASIYQWPQNDPLMDDFNEVRFNFLVKKAAADPCDGITVTFIHMLIQMKYFIINEEVPNTFKVRYNNKGCNLYKFEIA